MASRDALEIAKVQEMLGGCACSQMRQATRVVTALYDEVLRPAGLRSGQIAVLAAAHTHGPITVVRLADRLGLDRTTLTRNLRPLERDGLLESQPGQDRRRREINVTRQGQLTLARAYPHWKAAQARMDELLGNGCLARLLKELATACEQVGKRKRYSTTA